MRTHREIAPAFNSDAWTALESWETGFDSQFSQLESELVEIRRHLHAHPEPSGLELETTRFVASRLKQAGLEPWTCQNEDGQPTGLVADLDIGEPAAACPRVAIRADLDALRMPDGKTVSYASKTPDVAHACGHDAHTAITLGVALAAAGIRPPTTGSDVSGLRLRFVFQPAEETSIGARWMVDQGAVEGVDAIIGLHVDPEREVGHVGIRYGVLTANCDDVEIVVEGHGGHAARPHHTVDPIAAAAHLVGALYKFLPRSIDSRTPAVFTVGQIAGGYAANVIPERVELLGSLRTTDAGSRKTQQERILQICAGVAQNSGAAIKAHFRSPLKAVDNHVEVTAALDAASRRVVGMEKVEIIDRPSMGGEDFSVYLDKVPGALLRLGCADGCTEAAFLHSPLFDIDERALTLGARIVTRAALLLSLGSPK
jgi:amidohydrolase